MLLPLPPPPLQSRETKSDIFPYLCRRNLPANLNMISKLSYEPSRRLVNFYSKLYRTFGVTNFSSELLEYPEEFAQFSSRPPAAAAAPVEVRITVLRVSTYKYVVLDSLSLVSHPVAAHPDPDGATTTAACGSHQRGRAAERRPRLR